MRQPTKLKRTVLDELPEEYEPSAASSSTKDKHKEEPEEDDDEALDPDDRRITLPSRYSIERDEPRPRQHLNPRPKAAARRSDQEDETLTRAVAGMSSIPSLMSRADLPVVNTRTDPHVFAFLDECCNKTCHPCSWYMHAARRGMQFGNLFGEPRSFIIQRTWQCQGIWQAIVLHRIRRILLDRSLSFT